jgi:hypothetical protein
MKNPIRVSEAFDRKYEGKTVSWEGYIMKIKENQAYLFKGEHAVIILAKMLPSESEIHADLILSMDDAELEEYTSQLSSLETGSHFAFNATFISIGTEHKLHHMHCHSIEKLEGSIVIPPHVHQVHQRYDVTNTAASVAAVSVVKIQDISKESDHNDVHVYREGED